MKDLRRQVKTGIATALHNTSVDNLIGRAMGVSRNPLVICYHRVVQNFEESATRAMPSLLISTDMFEKHLDWLAQHFDMVSLEEILQSPQRPETGRKRRQATVTFDDGYADFYWNAFPILVEKNIPSSLFVVTDLVGTAKLQTHDELYLLVSQWFQHPHPAGKTTDDPVTVKLEAALALHSDPYHAVRELLAIFSQRELVDVMELLQARVRLSTQSLREFQAVSWSMLKTMTEQGVTIGSHTRSHVLLPHHDQESVMEELRGSREILESELGVPAKFLAYPDGQFDERIARAAETADYSAALTICNHLSQDRPRYSVPRTVLWEKSCINSNGHFSPAVMSCLVNGVFGLSSRCAQDHLVS